MSSRNVPLAGDQVDMVSPDRWMTSVYPYSNDRRGTSDSSDPELIRRIRGAEGHVYNCRSNRR